MPHHFRSTALPLDEDGLQAALDELKVKAPSFWAVLQVETCGCGFLPDRRPKILFERHIFHRRTAGRFDGHPSGVSDVRPGGYGSGGAAQYERLLAAIALDRRAALESCSWGLGQVMGFHAKDLGHDGVESFVKAMMASEAQQLLAMARFIERAGLAAALRSQDWPRFARGYNGPQYRINNYDHRLAGAYAALERGGVPDLSVRAGQVYLTFLGHDPRGVDGIMGRMTRSAMQAFQQERGLPLTDFFDEDTLAALRTAAL